MSVETGMGEDGAMSAPRPLWRRILRRGPWENVATVLIAGGVVMLMQPVFLDLYDTQMVTAGGGLPIKAGNETIGGIGVSGAPGGDKDEACASAGLDKIKDRLI